MRSLWGEDSSPQKRGAQEETGATGSASTDWALVDQRNNIQNLIHQLEIKKAKYEQYLLNEKDPNKRASDRVIIDELNQRISALWVQLDQLYLK